MKLAMIGPGKMIGGEADIVAQLTSIFDMRHQFGGHAVKKKEENDAG